MFRFKQFTIKQENSAMKVCTDSCLFGALIDSNNKSRILDIGTGTGLLSLMLAQKNHEAEIRAIEIDAGAFGDAELNFNNSPFSKKLRLTHQSLQEFQIKSHAKFDLIVCNPPFYENKLKSPIKTKNIAHHAESLSFDELIGGVKQFLSEEGSFWVILPPYEMQVFKEKCHFFFVNEVIKIRHKFESAVIREICHFTKNISNEILESEICIYNSDNKTYTERFVEILRDYYLIF